jgi:hypothetical protein
MARGAKVVEPEVVIPARENLEALITEINEVLNLEPAIKFSKKTTDAELVELIKAETVGNIYEIDFTADADDDTIPFFSEESAADFEALGIEIQAGSPPETPAEPAPAAKGKGKEKAAPAAAPAKGAAKPAAAAKTPKAPKAPAEKKYTRDMAVIESINQLCKKGAAFKTIMDTTDAIYVKNGGNSVPDAVNVNKYTLNGLVAFDVLTLKDGIYKFK